MERARRLLGLAGLALVLAIGVPLALALGQHASGFDGHIQSGTCAHPKGHVRVELKSRRTNDVNPYLTKNAQKPLAYYGAAKVPGFALAAAYAKVKFSLVITDPTKGGKAVACGDILKAHNKKYRRAGIALVQLLPFRGARVYGSALIQRTPLQRELDITPTVVRILLARGVPPKGPTEPAAGYDGYIQDGTCNSPRQKLKVKLKGHQAHDVNPYVGKSPSGPVTLGYYGAPGVPGFGLAAVYTGKKFSLVITGNNGARVACGNIRKAAAREFRRIGLAVVKLSPVRGSGVNGYSLIERTVLQRELNITPTRARVLLFAAPAT